MTRDHLAGITDRRDLGPYGFGLGFAIAQDRGISGEILSEGAFGWGGMAHTGFWIDPQEELVGVFMTQLLPDSPLPYRDLFRPVVYQAIVE
jgi:CubicO group peptidase (beta-lactamase class C family)